VVVSELKATYTYIREKGRHLDASSFISSTTRFECIMYIFQSFMTCYMMRGSSMGMQSANMLGANVLGADVQGIVRTS